ncbi:hypothetical protein [Actinokineospora pegani]|uniref:hypothetical protein n=1 Tax=Actinokineospora pegani TaxID=2654637 RepID=UPI0012E9E710|nr:hypothetical protein [Actinokineospora pegani]
MHTWAMRGLQTALVTGGLLMLGTGIASADEDVNPDRLANALDAVPNIPAHLDGSATGTPFGQRDLPLIDHTLSIPPEAVLGHLPLGDGGLEAADPASGKSAADGVPVAIDPSPTAGTATPLGTDNLTQSIADHVVILDWTTPVPIDGHALAGTEPQHSERLDLAGAPVYVHTTGLDSILGLDSGQPGAGPIESLTNGTRASGDLGHESAKLSRSEGADVHGVFAGDIPQAPDVLSSQAFGPDSGAFDAASMAPQAMQAVNDAAAVNRPARGPAAAPGEIRSLPGTVVNPLVQTVGDSVSDVASASAGALFTSRDAGDLTGHLTGDLTDIPAGALADPQANTVGALIAQAPDALDNTTAGAVGGISKTPGEVGNLSGLHGVLPVGGSAPIFGVPINILADAISNTTPKGDLAADENLVPLSLPKAGALPLTKAPTVLQGRANPIADLPTGGGLLSNVPLAGSLLDTLPLGRSGPPAGGNVLAGTRDFVSATELTQLIPALTAEGMPQWPTQGSPAQGLLNRPTDHIATLSAPGLPIPVLSSRQPQNSKARAATPALPIEGVLGGGRPNTNISALPTQGLLGGVLNNRRPHTAKTRADAPALPGLNTVAGLPQRPTHRPAQAPLGGGRPSGHFGALPAQAALTPVINNAHIHTNNSRSDASAMPGLDSGAGVFSGDLFEVLDVHTLPATGPSGLTSLTDTQSKLAGVFGQFPTID